MTEPDQTTEPGFTMERGFTVERRVSRESGNMPEPAHGPEPGLALSGLTVRFGAVEALSDITAEFHGRATGLLGPNGAGKSTLIRTLLGFHWPTSGTARILGQDIRSAGPEVRAQIGYMPESDAYVAGMSAVRTVRLMAELSGLSRQDALERTHEALNYVGLGEARYRPVGTYSLGMRQLVKLAQAIVHGPRLLFLDEPTNALDPPARHRMLELIRDIRDSGEVQVIVSSHLLRDVESACDEVVILREGRLVARHVIAPHAADEVAPDQSRSGEARAAHVGGAMREDSLMQIEVETSGEPEQLVNALRAGGCLVEVGARGRILVGLRAHMDTTLVYRVAEDVGARITRLAVRRASLEDIFMAAMSGDEIGEMGGEEMNALSGVRVTAGGAAGVGSGTRVATVETERAEEGTHGRL